MNYSVTPPTILRPDTRREMVLELVTRHPLATCKDVSDLIMSETRGKNYVPTHRITSDLKLLESHGKVKSLVDPECRALRWRARV